MPVAVIAGFQYKEHRFLNGYLLDLFRAYQYAKSINCSQIVILTDDDPAYPETIASHVQDDNITLEIYNFLWVPIDTDYQVIRALSKDDVIHHLARTRSPDQKIFFYYTGHGCSQGLECPDSSIIESQDLRDALVDHNQAFFIIDSCYTPSLYLPYIYGSQAQLSQGLIQWEDKELIMIAPTDSQSKCVIMHHGSPFTRSIFKLLIHKQDCLILSDLQFYENGQSQCPSIIRSSYPLNSVLPSWITSGPITYQGNYLILHTGT